MASSQRPCVHRHHGLQPETSLQLRSALQGDDRQMLLGTIEGVMEIKNAISYCFSWIGQPITSYTETSGMPMMMFAKVRHAPIIQ